MGTRRPRPARATRSAYAGFRFPPDVIVLAVGWYLRFGLSYRDVEELLAERGIEVDHVTIYRWVLWFAPLLAEADRTAVWVPLAAEQDVELTFQPGPTAPVWAVPGALEQVLDNLLANALRVAPAGSRVELAIRHAGGWVELHVTDRGPGMSAEQRQRAFDRFWRGPTLDRDGTGLGLAIVRQLLEAGGGTAELHPNPGGGLDAVARLRPAHHDPTARQGSREPGRTSP